MRLFPLKTPQNPDPVELEKLRQARWCFNAAIAIVATSASISCLGAILIAIGRIPPNHTAAIVAIASNLTSTGFFQIVRDSRRLLEEKDLKRS